jgi:hypothetical protein
VKKKKSGFWLLSVLFTHPPFSAVFSFAKTAEKLANISQITFPSHPRTEQKGGGGWRRARSSVANSWQKLSGQFGGKICR